MRLPIPTWPATEIGSASKVYGTFPPRVFVDGPEVVRNPETGMPINVRVESRECSVGVTLHVDDLVEEGADGALEIPGEKDIRFVDLRERSAYDRKLINDPISGIVAVRVPRRD